MAAAGAMAAAGVLIGLVVAGYSGLDDRLARADHQLSLQGQKVAALQQRVGAAEEHLAAEEQREAAAARLPAIVEPSVFTVEFGAVSGTAWVISSGPQSLLITAEHVVDGARPNTTVTLRTSTTAMVGTVQRLDLADDLALISVPHRLPALPVQQTLPAVGTAVFVVGSPMGLSGTLTEGTVSAIRTEAGTSYLQFSAAISPGSSGSPVVEADGKVVGIVVAKVVDHTEGLSFAVPVRAACSAFAVCPR